MLKVEPIYTGGNIYVFYGQLNEKEYFMADSCELDVMILDADPWKAGYDLPFEYEWQQEHVVKYVDEKESVSMFIDIIKWVLENKPKGNYLVEDMEYLLDYAKECNNIINK